jgi:hypothetical protein
MPGTALLNITKRVARPFHGSSMSGIHMLRLVSVVDGGPREELCEGDDGRWEFDGEVLL